MSRLALAVFAVLVAATLGAFFVVQRLKQAPRLVRTLSLTSLFSPNGDNRREVATIRFRLDKRSDRVTVTLLSSGDEPVRRLVRDRSIPADVDARFLWDGKTDEGVVAPDGAYRVRIGLRRQGRSAILLRSIRLDTEAPRPVVQVLGQERRSGPLVVTPGTPVGFRYVGQGSHLPPRFVVYRSDLRPMRIVTRLRGSQGSRVSRWNGRIRGRPAPPGTYFIAARIRDRASNVGTSPPLRPSRAGTPRSRPGVTVRRLAVQPPLEPARAGRPVRFFVDSRGAPYRWRVRRLGAAGELRSGRGRRPLLAFRAPRRRTGTYLLEVRRAGALSTVPFAVQAGRRRPVLVVLPALTWQGLNPVDDDGNGAPNVLRELSLPTSVEDDSAVRLNRVFAGNGFPTGFRSHEGPLLTYLEQAGLRYDLTTDLGLSRHPERLLSRHRGIVLAGNPGWLPGPLLQRLRRWVRSGGRIFVVGTDALRRSVRVEGGRAMRPSRFVLRDVFGVQAAPLRRSTDDLLVFPGDRLGLFAGTDGLFSGFRTFQAIEAAGPEAEVASAAGEEEGRAVIVAFRVGRGIVIRTGLPQWSVRLREEDANVAAVTRRAWTLLSR